METSLVNQAVIGCSAVMSLVSTGAIVFLAVQLLRGANKAKRPLLSVIGFALPPAVLGVTLATLLIGTEILGVVAGSALVGASTGLVCGLLFEPRMDRS